MATGLYGIVPLQPGDEKNTVTSNPPHTLGQFGITSDGRWCRWSKTGAAIGAGNVVMQKAGQTTWDMDIEPVAGSVGDKSITLDGGTSGVAASTQALSANDYEDGYIYVNDGAGEGHTYLVERHDAFTTGTTAFTVHLKDNDAVAEAITTASKLGLMKNPFFEVETWDVSDVDGPPLGVAPVEISAADTYFWCLVVGPQATLTNTGSSKVPVVGESVIAGTASAADGAVEGEPESSGNRAIPVIGEAMLIAAVSGDYGMINWNRL